jgi:predicted nuclease with TOPRIM domain
MDELVRENAGLILKLQVAEIEVDNLRSEIERMENERLALTGKLEDAKSEIARLDMVMKRRRDDSETVRRLGKPPSC